MRAHDRRVDEDVFKVRIITQGPEKTLENPGLAPPVEADVNAVPLSEMSRQRSPMCTGSRQPENGFHEQTVVLPGPTRITCLARQMGLHQRPNAVIEFLFFQSCWPPAQ